MSDATHVADAINRNTKAIEAQTEGFKELIAFLIHGPEFKEVEFGSAEEDKIDDSAGVYDTHEQAKQDILQQWRDDGYPDEVFKYFEQRP